MTRHVAAVVEAERRKKLGEQAEAVVEQRVFLLCGQGGSGKTEVTKICREMFVKFLGPGSEVAMAYSNSAARVLGGDTIHSCLHMHGEAGLDLESLSKGVTPELMDGWRDVKAALIDEVSMVPPRLLGAASYRMCLGRRGEAEKYMERGHMFGGVPIVILLGDFLQLAPFERKRRVSLLKAPVAGRRIRGLST